MNTPLSDEELVLQAQKGDITATEQLLFNCKNLVKTICRRYFLVGGEFEDLLQEGMIGLSNAIATFKSNYPSFKSFAKVCITRKIQSAIRSANTKRNQALNSSVSITRTDNDGEDYWLEIPSPMPSPDEMLQTKDELSEVMSFIDSHLSILEKTVLKHYLIGLSYSEIGELVNKSPKSVENAITRLRTKLLHLKQN